MSAMLMIIIAIVAVLVITGILLVVLLWKRQKDGIQVETDYRAFFIMGVTFIPVGIAMLVIYLLAGLPFIVALPFIILGLVYIVLGFNNRDKWRKKDKDS